MRNTELNFLFPSDAGAGSDICPGCGELILSINHYDEIYNRVVFICDSCASDDAREIRYRKRVTELPETYAVIILEPGVSDFNGYIRDSGVISDCPDSI